MPRLAPVTIPTIALCQPNHCPLLFMKSHALSLFVHIIKSSRRPPLLCVQHHFYPSKQSKQTQAKATWHGSSQDGMVRRLHFTTFTLFTIYLQPSLLLLIIRLPIALLRPSIHRGCIVMWPSIVATMDDLNNRNAGYPPTSRPTPPPSPQLLRPMRWEHEVKNRIGN